MPHLRSLLVIAVCACISTAAVAQDNIQKPMFQPDGSVHVPAFDLPPSSFLTPEALAMQESRAKHAGGAPHTSPDIAVQRHENDEILKGSVDAMLTRYSVDIVDQTIAGVHTRVVTPKGKPVDPNRILINLHGGGFSMCAYSCAILESIPIAALGNFKVISVDYRMAPEAKNPSAMEDLSAVYKEVLKTYKAKQIGIYGCSAGGALTGAAGAWLPSHGMPQAGALGIFGSGAVRAGQGDSAWVTAYIDGAFPPPPKPGENRPDSSHGYFAGDDMSSPLISPALHQDVLAKFPPTMIVTGTRAPDMSPAVFTNSALIKAGVHSTLIVGEGMGHCYIYQANMPEAQDTQHAIVNFFRENLD